MIVYLEAAGGLAILLLGGDALVRGSVSLARRFQVPYLLIGLTVVAFGTSAPELVVGVGAALEGVPRLALGNVVGSNIANVLLVIGIPALLRPIGCAAFGFRRDTWLMLIASAVFILMAWQGTVGRWDGIILLLLLIAFLAYVGRKGQGDQNCPKDGLIDFDALDAPPVPLGRTLFLIAFGIGGLLAGSNLLIGGAIGIARAMSIPESVIGLTLVAVGTSLPELATSLAATLRRHGGVAVGNVIGSNMFNILGVMGATAITTPVPVPPAFLQFDFWIMLGSSALLLPLAYFCNRIGRRAGVILVSLYVLYIFAIFHGLMRAGFYNHIP